jgi:hypothetical protein
MDTILLTIILIASLVLAPLVLLVISGQLIRSRMHSPATTGRGKRDLQELEDALVEFFARCKRDLRGLEDALVEFFARSKASSCILTVLAARGKPIGFNALVGDILAEQQRRGEEQDLSRSALRTVLTILQVVRLIHMNRDGFFLTELGKEVYRRMTSLLEVRAAVRQQWASRLQRCDASCFLRPS